MKIYFKQLFVLVLSIFFINVLMVYGVQEVVAKNEPLLAKHVSGDEKYTKYEIGDYIVYHQQRMIGDAVVEKDFKTIQFHKYTKKLHKKIDTFREGLPTRIETVMSKEKAHASVEGKVIYSMKMIIHPKSDIFKFKPTPQNPCHVVWHEVGGEIIITVFDAVTGKKIGNGISPPSSGGFAFSGPIDYSPCNPTYVWQAWIDSGGNFFTTMGYPTTKMTNPQKSAVAPYVQNSLYPVIYEFGHGSSTSFVNHCSGGYELIYASDVESWMSSVPAKWFVFFGHCDGMCQTGDNTLSYEYRKGSSSQTTTVGYCGMSHGSCATCWSSSLDWQNRMFSYIENGYTVYQAFTQATADYPHCSSCVRFAGDDNYCLPHINVKKEPLKYGQYVHIQNAYADWASYLDTCGGASCGGNRYNVSTSVSPDRASGTGTWEIISASGKAGGSPVLVGDSLHLKNKYGTGSYLDTCGGASCGGNKYNVSTSSSPDRVSGSGTGTWRFVETY